MKSWILRKLRSEFLIPLQRCIADSTILPSLRGNVAKSMSDTDIINIFVARNNKLKAKRYDN